MSAESTDIWSDDKSDDIEPGLPQCPICHGAGFVHPLLESGRPDYRRVVPCRCVQEKLEKEKQEQLQKYSNLGSLSRLTFDNLFPEGRRYGGKYLFDFKNVYDSSLSYAHDPSGWLILIGPNGSGKTHLAAAIANYQISISRPAFYIEAADLLDHLRATYSGNSYESYDDLFEQIKETPLLLLDDLNSSAFTPWAKEKFQQLFNHRFNKQLPTVITASIPVEELEQNLDSHLTDPDFCKICNIRSRLDLEMEHFGGLELELIKKMSFDNFDYKRLNLSAEQRQNLEQVFQIAFNFAKSPTGWLVLLGENGCGKTHLAASIANYLHDNNKPVLFVVVPDFLDHLRAAFNPDKHISYDNLFEKVKKYPVLILDDFNEQAVTSWTQEKLYQLINYRYNARLATVITTSYSLDEIENRISSRMVDPSISLVFNIVAPDYRGDRKMVDKKPRMRNRKPD